jgi:hypothetical protein
MQKREQDCEDPWLFFETKKMIREERILEGSAVEHGHRYRV